MVCHGLPYVLTTKHRWKASEKPRWNPHMAGLRRLERAKAMIAALSPAGSDYDETMSTLQRLVDPSSALKTELFQRKSTSLDPSRPETNKGNSPYRPRMPWKSRDEALQLAFQ